MKNIGVLFVVVSAVMVSACGSTPVAATPPVATATSLTLTPGTSFMLSGHTETFIATATLSGGGTQVVTPAWSVDNAGVLSIDAAGRATARATGTSNVIAIYQGQQATRLVRVAPDYQGRWVGTYLVTACNESGDFQRASFCSLFLDQTQPVTLTLTQNLDQVAGTIVLFSSPTGTCRGRWPTTAPSCCAACSRERSA